LNALGKEYFDGVRWWLNYFFPDVGAEGVKLLAMSMYNTAVIDDILEEYFFPLDNLRSKRPHPLEILAQQFHNIWHNYSEEEPLSEKECSLLSSIPMHERILSSFKNFTSRVRKFDNPETINASPFIQLYKQMVICSTWYRDEKLDTFQCKSTFRHCR
jgi:hypothetical protein